MVITTLIVHDGVDGVVGFHNRMSTIDAPYHIKAFAHLGVKVDADDELTA